jgi:hypothetical protein
VGRRCILGELSWDTFCVPDIWHSHVAFALLTVNPRMGASNRLTSTLSREP